jgi:energy-coupling factor transporter ATP-binding protein EcfA2
MVCSAFDHPLAHAFIAIQAGQPVLFVGPPGCGKTSTLAALSRALQRRFVGLLGTQCTPEDVSGLPVPDLVKKLCRMMPMAWVEALLTPGGFLFLDEFTAVPPSVQAALLTVIQDLRVGDLRLDLDTLVCAACNPSEITPNGQPLSLPTNNRFFHAVWQKDREAWLDGLETLTWEDPVFPVVPTSWRSQVPRWGTLTKTFLRRSDNLDSVIPTVDDQPAYPTERSWANAIRCLAAADAAGCDMSAGSKFVRLMVEGNVGETAAMQFATWRNSYDLVDPLELLDGTAKFQHDDARPDLTLNVCASVLSAVQSPATFTTDRWDAAAAFYAEVAKVAAPEIALKSTGALQKAAVANGYAPNAKALKPLIELGQRMKVAG